MDHEKPGSVSNPLAFNIADQFQPFPLFFRDINDAFFSRKIIGYLSRSAFFMYAPLMCSDALFSLLWLSLWNWDGKARQQSGRFLAR